MDKKELRAFIRNQKKLLSDIEVVSRSKIVLDKLYSSEYYKQSQDIYTYVNYNQEISTIFLIEEALKCGKNVYVPKVFGDKMEFFKINSIIELKPGAYGILEPDVDITSQNITKDCMKDNNDKESANPKANNLMIMPGLAFDLNHNRIGYGGGFYDRYLNDNPIFYKIALCFDFQVVDLIETDEYDIPVDLVISESKIF